MPKNYKRLSDYLIKEDFFIYDRKVISKSDSINFYWYVFFPPYLNLPSKAFNKLMYKKEDALAFRNLILRNYINDSVQNDYKDILQKYI